MKNLLLPALAVASLCGASDNSHLLLQKPTLSRTHIVFNYAGDLWSVPREGGDATRLTTGAGVETNPVFSPDGSQIAFTGEYDGNVDAYVMPAAGGVPKRLTWHPAPDTVLNWTPDGKRILFTSPRTAYSRFQELYTTGLEGGLEEKVALPMGYEGAYSADGTKLAYVPLPRAFTAWKRYRGGRTTPVWIVTVATGHVEKIPREDSNDFNPMWIGDKVYFLSDRGGPVSLYSYDLAKKQVKPCLENNGLDIKSASAGPGAIVYEQFGSLHLYDLKSGKAKAVEVRVSGDLPELREHFVNVWNPSSVVIVGAGASGAACAEKLRAKGYDGPVTLVGDEEPGPVDRPNLSKDFLAGTATEDWIPLRTREYYESIQVELITSDPAVRFSPADHQVSLRSGRILNYGALLLATGAEHRSLSIEGADLPTYSGSVL